MRNELIMALAEALPKDCLFLGCNIQAATLDEHGACLCSGMSGCMCFKLRRTEGGNGHCAGNGIVTLSDGTELRPKILVGADGANSKVKSFIMWSCSKEANCGSLVQ